ncbi:hypothetical protein Tco_1089795 [Tanacetum coccineum]
MTRSSIKELFTPFKDLKREFRSSRKLFKTLSLEESRSPEFNLFSNLEENPGEEVTKTMVKTMEQYMSKTRADYGSGIARPKIDDKDHFELKGQFLKKLRDNTFSGSDHEDANEHIEKVIQIVDLFHISNITQDQVMLRVFPMSLTRAVSHWLRNKPSGSIKTWEDLKIKFLSKYCPPARNAKKMEEVGCKLCKGPHYTKDCPLKEEGKTLEEAHYTQFGAPFQQGGQYRAAAPGFYQRNNANPSYQERRQSMEESLSKFISESTKKHKENSNLIKEIRTFTDAAIRNQGASIKTLEIQIEQMSKVLQERGFGSLPSFTKTNPKDHVKSISTTVEAYMTPICHIRSSQYAKGSYGLQCLYAYSYGATRIDDSLPRKEKDPGSFTLPCYINNVCFKNALADLGASVSVMPLSTYLNIGLGELAYTKLTVELADITVKHPKGIAKNVLVGIGKFIFPVDFIILDMPEDVKVPLIIGRPFLSTAHAKIDVFKRKITLRVGDERIIFKSVKPASSLIKRVYMLSLRERIELDLEARLMGETLVLNRSLDPLYGDYIELNDLNVPLEVRRDQVDNLMPTIEEGEVIDKPMIDIIKTRNNESFDEYPSFCDFDRKIHIDRAYNLRFSCMIGFEHVNANFFPNFSVNVMSKKFYNSLIKDKVEYKGKNVVGAFMSVPIFVRNFSVITHFAVVENMDGYRYQDMGDVIFGEPFCKASCVEARRFDGLITIHNGNDNVTYQMTRSHPRFNLSNAQCNKIKPLLKVFLYGDLAGKEIENVGEVSII